MHQILNENNKSPPARSQKLALLSSSYKKLKESQDLTPKKTESKLRQQSMTRLSFPETNGLINEPSSLITKSFFKEKTESLKSTELRSKPSSSSSSQVSFQYFKWKNSRYKPAQYNSEEEEIPQLPQQQQQTYQQKFMRTSELFSINPKVIHSSNKIQSPIKNKNEKPGEKLEDNSNVVQNVQTFHLPSLSFKAPNKRALDSTSNHNQTHRINEFASKNTKHFTTSIDGKKLIDDDRPNGKFKNQDDGVSASLNEKNNSAYLKEKPLNPVDFYIKMNLVNNPNLFSAIQTNALAQNSTNVISTLSELNSNKYLPLNANSIKKLKKLLNLDEFTSLVNYRANKNKENLSFNAAEIKANAKPKVVLNALTSSITSQQKNSQPNSIQESSNAVNLPPVLRIEKSDLYLKWAERKQNNEKNMPFDASTFHNDESAEKSYQTNDELINGEGQVPIKILIKKREEKYSQNNHETAPWSTPQRTGSFSFSDNLGGSLHELSNLNSKQIDAGKNHVDSHPEVCLLCQRENEIRNKESIDLLALDINNFNELVPTVQLYSQVNKKAARIASPPLSPHQMFHKSISDSDIKLIKKAVCFPPPTNVQTKKFI